MQIQYASDLHIDEWPLGTPFGTFLVPSAPFLILAGDVCSVWNPLFQPFMHWCSRNWHTVLFVAGNHEYYSAGQTMEETDAQIYKVTAELGNLFFLQNGASYIFPHTRIRVCGATLWSAVDPAQWESGFSRKKDCKMIFAARGVRLHPAAMTELHTRARSDLAIATKPWCYGEALIVVTHYLPTKRLLEPHYVGDEWHTFYANDDEDLFRPNMVAWICGHGHRSTTLYTGAGAPVLLMNARGHNRVEELGRTDDRYDPTKKLIL